MRGGLKKDLRKKPGQTAFLLIDGMPSSGFFFTPSDHIDSKKTTGMCSLSH